MNNFFTISCPDERSYELALQSARRHFPGLITNEQGAYITYKNVKVQLVLKPKRAASR